MDKTALVLGASGRFGRHVAAALEADDWTVRRFDRQTGHLPDAAEGVDLIVNGWNPLYGQWSGSLLPLTQQVIDAAQHSGATILQPANIYVYGAGSPTDLTRATPHRATNQLGILRIEMEDALRQSGVRVILLRAGDFIDDRPSGNWFDRIITAKSRRGRFTYPGDPDIPHAWAYLPDLAKAAVVLAACRAELETFEEVLFPGHTLSGHQMGELVADALDMPQRVTRMNWLPVRLAQPFWREAKHLLEMRYLWSMPHRIADPRLQTLCPELVSTDPRIAIVAALQHQIDPDKPVS